MLEQNYEILNYLDDLTISLDSIDSKTNEVLGRGDKHFATIHNILNYINSGNYKKLKVNINTVVNKQNLEEIEELGDFLNNYKIGIWKLYQFMPLRESAEKNREIFEITNFEFDSVLRKVYEKYENISCVTFKKQEDLEKNILILANGDIIKTENGIDFLLGNAINDNVVKYIDEYINMNGDSIMKKIRALIAYDDDKTKDEIVNILKRIEDVEIVATTKNPEDTYNKIIEFKPEMVFSKYDFGTNMNGLDIIKQSKKALNENVPAFNFIALDIPKEEYLEAKKIIGDKMNTVIREQTQIRYEGIIDNYKEYLNAQF